MKQVPYSVAIARKYPEHIAWAVTWDEQNSRPDIIVLGWAMPTSNKPPMLAVSIAFTRHSHKLLAETGEFVLAFPSVDMAAATTLCGTKSGRDTDKMAECGLRALPASRVRPPLIDGCPACFECIVRGRLDTGDHTVFAGEVVAAHVCEDETVARLYNWSGEFGPAVRP
ncbi:MAG: flavin reductase family protein [Planctomycetes bacterium]|nr:flavin reductase family protein [Planctomycetota bacterium]